ncbi:hypothetical protein ABFS82_14G219000 [Erythranthe guttata]|uniref:protein TRAUCO-like isoform X1 n=1 Tax=Erythranthe guttata TaxID=4155 RepID=UPI00064DD92E|nr:PREDICTED: protein TRAUCO-like isoform X1 [Erythranthe guttata]|eukprot:XP_012844671.1 PREDICTED: protein TRAUCO-like isoform X1 [Erythranthe guttata]
MEDANETPIPPPPATDGGAGAASNSAELTALPDQTNSESKTDKSGGVKEEPEPAASEELSSDDTSVYGTPQAPEDEHADEEEEEELEPSPKKQKLFAESPKIEPSEHGMTELPSPADAIPDPPQNGKPPATKSGKKSKKKSKDVWTTTSRKGKKKTKHAFNGHNSKKSANGGGGEDKVLIIPAPRYAEKSDDSPAIQIGLSKIYKAEKVELSDDRLTAGSTKGYRMVRATRGVTEGAWYYEIKVVHLGETGHTRLGWSTDKADLQAPVGYDGNSFGYRDMDGSKVHKALREKYGDEGYKEGDVIGFFINLPEGGSYAPNPPRMVWYKGQRYVTPPDVKEDPPKVVPGSEISFFKNGICQGVAYRDLYGGQYYPAASMYTLPNQQNCVVKFNFGPDFEMFPKEFGDRPLPRAMIEIPYQGHESSAEIGSPMNITRMRPMFKEE